MKELKRRGMTPTSLLEDTKKSTYDLGLEEERGFSKRNAVSTEPGNNLTNQREQSMALNSEGLEVGKLKLFFLFVIKFQLL